MLWKNLMEEVFFFQYHLRVDKFTCMKYYVNERRYIIERFIQQKNSEKEEIDKERRKAQRKR
jgi:hypothetical protein